MRKVLVSPSLLSADFSKLNEEIKSIEDAGADYLHFDVMDGHFVPNISFGLPVLKSIKNTHSLVNDVHIMISEPKKYAKEFVEKGADILTFHIEAVKDVKEAREVINIIHENGARAGVSIKPNTPVSKIVDLLSDVDLVLIMSVEPGFGGQSFMPVAVDKIKELRSIIDEENLFTLIEVDGGINEETGKLCREAGADILVAGTYVFKAENRRIAIEKLRK